MGKKIYIKEIREMVKEIIKKGALFITLGAFATQFVGVLGSIFVVRVLAKSEYGLLGYVENIYGYLYIFAGVGLGNAMLRYLIKAERREKIVYFKYIYSRTLIIDFLLSLLLVVCNFFMHYPSDFARAKYLLPMITFLLPCQDSVNNGLVSLRASFKTKEYAICSFMISSLLILGRILGAYLAGVEGVIISRVFINGISAIVLYYFSKKSFVVKEYTDTISQNAKKEIFSYSIQYMLTNGIWSMFMLNDVFILGLFVTESKRIADYKVAYSLPAMLTFFSSSVGVFFGPFFTKHEEDKDWVRKNFLKLYFSTALIVGVVAGGLALFARPLVCILYGEDYLNILTLLRVLILASFMNAGLRYTTANILAVMGKIKYNMFISLIGIFFQVLLDVILVQKYQEIGIACSSCIVYLFLAVILWIIFHHEYFRKERN